jgi:uncharacterized protein YjiS (DUF1127 family)
MNPTFEGREMAEQAIQDTALFENTNAKLFDKWLTGYRAWRKRGREIAELRSLSAATLRDLAIDRSEVSSVISAGVGERRRNHI